MWRNWHPENWGTQGEVFAFLLHTSIDPSAKISLMIQLLISQMKELGVIVYNCSCLVLDLQRIFALYSSLRYKNKIPPSWSKRLYGVYDTQNKLTLQLNETKSEAFVSVSSEMSSRVGGKGRNLTHKILEDLEIWQIAFFFLFLFLWRAVCQDWRCCWISFEHYSISLSL